MRSCRPALLAVGAWALLALQPLWAGEMPDLSKIDRAIAKEPKYVAKQPLYGLYVFGPVAKTHAWAVFDKSKADLDDYDILYFDRKANGDLTEPGNRIVGKSNNFEIGSFTDPVTADTHTNISISRQTGQHGMVMMNLKWKNKIEIRGGYAEDPGPYTQFGTSPDTAPVLWPSADGPLGFQRWGGGKLTIAGSDDMRVFLGHQGHGKNTFCGLPQTFLPDKAAVLATVIYTDKDGKEARCQSELTDRC